MQGLPGWQNKSCFKIIMNQSTSIPFQKQIL